MSLKHRRLKRKISAISGREESSDSSSVSTMQQWNDGKYDTIYLDLLFEAVVSSFSYSMGKLYEVEFWDAFTSELNKRIKTDFPDDTQFIGFTRPAVISYGSFLRATHRRFKDNPGELANFGHYDKCFRKCTTCDYTPVFPNFESRSSAKWGSAAKMSFNSSSSTSTRKRGSRTRTSGNEELYDQLSVRPSSFFCE